MGDSPRVENTVGELWRKRKNQWAANKLPPSETGLIKNITQENGAHIVQQQHSTAAVCTMKMRCLLSLETETET